MRLLRHNKGFDNELLIYSDINELLKLLKIVIILIFYNICNFG
jgi:hypothetical protein